MLVVPFLCNLLLWEVKARHSLIKVSLPSTLPQSSPNVSVFVYWGDGSAWAVGMHTIMQMQHAFPLLPISHASGDVHACSPTTSVTRMKKQTMVAKSFLIPDEKGKKNHFYVCKESAQVFNWDAHEVLCKIGFFIQRLLIPWRKKKSFQTNASHCHCPLMYKNKIILLNYLWD